jgi:hypothetical protein
MTAFAPTTGAMTRIGGPYATRRLTPYITTASTAHPHTAASSGSRAGHAHPEPVRVVPAVAGRVPLISCCIGQPASELRSSDRCLGRHDPDLGEPRRVAVCARCPVRGQPVHGAPPVRRVGPGPGCGRGCISSSCTASRAAPGGPPTRHRRTLPPTQRQPSGMSPDTIVANVNWRRLSRSSF